MSASNFTHLVQTFRGGGAVLRFAAVPDRCPACGHSIEPRRLAAHSTSPDDLLVDFAFQCPQAPCRRIFIAEYAREEEPAFALRAVHGLTPHQTEYRYPGPWAGVY
ncbi:MAG TPA: hypothetical protein VF613_07655 [Longimicrobium sp.]